MALISDAEGEKQEKTKGQIDRLSDRRATVSAEEKINERGRGEEGTLSERIIQHTACCDCVILL